MHQVFDSDFHRHAALHFAKRKKLSRKSRTTGCRQVSSRTWPKLCSVTGIYRNETGMFSTELTYRRRRNPRRTIYACLAVAAVAALSAGLAYALPVLEVNDRMLQRASWRHVALWAGSTLSLLAALAAAIVHFWRTATRSHDSLQSIRWLSPREFNRL